MTAQPYYADDAVTLYQGDCLDVMRQLPDGSVDAVITDAPYNAGFLYGDGTNDARSWGDYAEWLGLRVEQMERIARGPVMVYVSVRGMVEMCRIRPPRWVGAWARSSSGNPAGDNRGTLILPTWEPCLFYGNMGAFKYATPDLWRIGGVGERNGHPCPKPISLMAAMIAKAPFGSLLDPFAGSGTTLRAAKDAGLRAVGIEIEGKYCQLIADRMAQEVLDFGGAA